MICTCPRCTGAGAPERSQQVIAKSDSPMRIRRLFAVNRRGRCPHRPGRTHRFCGNLRVYLKTPNAPGQRAFLRCAASFFLEIRQYSCEKMSCATQKSLAAGHIMSFQIHPSFAFKICRAARICRRSYEFAEDFRKNSISEKAYGLMLREAESVCLLFI